MTKEDPLEERPLVLIADDDEVFRLLARQAMEHVGCSVVEACRFGSGPRTPGDCLGHGHVTLCKRIEE